MKLASSACRALALFAACAACTDRPAHGRDPSAGLELDDFAYSIELRPEAGRAVHTALLPPEVYRGVRSQNLSDLRVFNAAGEQVPHAIRTLDAAREVALGEQPLPLFPLRVPAGPNPVVLDQLSLRVERDAKGTAISVQAAPPAQEPAKRKPAKPEAESEPPPAGEVVAYILDASALEQPITGLRIQLADAGSGDRVRTVAIDQSDDLSHFATAVEGQALINLSYAGQHIARDAIAVPALRAKYLRLRWPADQGALAVDAVFAKLGPTRADAERKHARVRGRSRAGEASVYDFDLGGFMPVDALRVVLPQDNTLVQAELRSSSRADEAGTVLWSGTSYRVLHQGRRLESPAVAVRRTNHRYFQLRVADKGGGIGRGLPELAIEYYPDQLLFVARGEPPFQLAYGHHSAVPTGFSDSDVLALVAPAGGAQLPPSDTQLGQPTRRAGPAALTAPPPPLPIKRYALWAILIAGALGLLIAALRMTRGAA